MNELAVRTEDEKLGIHHWPLALSFPFRDRSCLQRLWLAPAACLVPVLGLLVIKGWRVGVIRRRMQEDAAADGGTLPAPADLGRFIADGLRVLLARGIYMLPLIVIMAVSFQHTIESVLEIGRWVIAQFSAEHRGHASIFMILLHAAFGVASKFVVPVTYYYLLKPLLYAGTLRFAITGRFRSLVNLPAQVMMLTKHLNGFMLLFLLNVVTALCLNVVSVLMASTGVGVVLIPLVTVPLYNAASGYLIGTLGRQLSA